jgi:hypothetical protein
MLQGILRRGGVPAELKEAKELISQTMIPKRQLPLSAEGIVGGIDPKAGPPRVREVIDPLRTTPTAGGGVRIPPSYGGKEAFQRGLSAANIEAQQSRLMKALGKGTKLALPLLILSGLFGMMGGNGELDAS